MKRTSIILATLVLTCLAYAGQSNSAFSRYFGPSFKVRPVIPPRGPTKGMDTIHRWNTIAIDASGIDHTPGFGQALGPGRASRAMAIVHIAMFDAVNAIVGGYESYSGVLAPRGAVSIDAAISQAAHDTLVALFSLQSNSFDSALAADLAKVGNKSEKARGIDLGQRAAAAVLAMRVADGAEIPEPLLGPGGHPTSDQPGHWRQDPISLIPVAVGAHWGECRPFVLQSGDQFRAPPPPDMASVEYKAAFDEAQALGGDGVITPTFRTEEQTFIGIFWAYDGTPSLCAPPRLYNQLTLQIADKTKLKVIDLARLLALVNTAMADAGIAIWESKFFYDFWRPIGGIREADTDNNPGTVANPTFMPLGAPASNLAGPNFTPPFPSYPSGHAGFGGALFQTLRRFYGTDNIPFTFVSDEFNGQTRGNDGNLRPLRPRSFATLSQAEEENGQSRIYLGIHWSFDKVEAIELGRKVGDYVVDNAFRPLKPNPTPTPKPTPRPR